jgi:predicted GIY-YIG superfamily endonuclease
LTKGTRNDTNGIMRIPEPKHKICGAEFNSLTGHAVYGWKRGNDFLYIGSTGNFLDRVGSHNIIGKVEPVQNQDQIIVWPGSEDFMEVMAFEAELNRKFRPKYSTPLLRGEIRELPCITCGNTFKQTRWWQKYCSRACGGSAKRYFLRPNG